MKKLVITSLIAALGGLLAVPQASAKNEGLAAIGGFLGGVIVASSIRDHDRRSDYRPDYRQEAYCPPAPVVCQPPVSCYAPPVPRGYWKEVPVRVWVPARWVRSYDRRGCEVRVLQSGYYTESCERVWVGRS